MRIMDEVLHTATADGLAGVAAFLRGSLERGARAARGARAICSHNRGDGRPYLQRNPTAVGLRLVSAADGLPGAVHLDRRGGRRSLAPRLRVYPLLLVLFCARYRDRARGHNLGMLEPPRYLWSVTASIPLEAGSMLITTAPGSGWGGTDSRYRPVTVSGAGRPAGLSVGEALAGVWIAVSGRDASWESASATNAMSSGRWA